MALSLQKFIAEPSERGGVFRLVEKGLLGRDRIISPDQWTAAAKGSLLAGAGRLLGWLDEEIAERDGHALIVGHATIASLDEGSARSVGLPPLVPWVLDLRHEGTLDQPEFRFRVSWRNENGQPQLNVQRIGAFLRSGSRTFRLSGTLFNLAEAIDAFNATPTHDLDERFRVWGRMRAQLPEESQRSVELDGYLRGTRIAHAARFSLDIRTGEDGFRFEPVLFGPEIPATEDDESQVSQEGHGILPSAQQDEFADKRFPASAECKARYALEGGWYVVVDEPVRQALSVVRRAQKSDRETRRQFARNPRAFLRHALGETFDESAIERLFVETAEYSERVKDVTLWSPIVVPWIKRPTEPWLPETFGIQIGDQVLPIEGEKLPEIEQAIRDAIAAGNPTISFDGVTVPANEETLAAIRGLKGVVSSAGKKTSADNGTAPEKERRQPVVLQISDNLEDIEYEQALKPRAQDMPDCSPYLLITSPKPHQEEGLRWLQKRWRDGMPGVLLADDMGLGKTLQALTFLAWLKTGMDAGRLRRQPFLIVAPTGLLKNWQAEHDRHLQAPGLGHCLEAYGASLKRLRKGSGTEIAAGRAMLDVAPIMEADWVLTTYETMRDYQHSFGAVRFAAAIFDEAQRIKTPGILMTHAAKALNGDFTITMTGTPVENRLADLWCIVDTAFPGRLGDLKTFSQVYEKDENPTKLRQLKGLLSNGRDGAPPMMLRRMKSDHLPGLPEKHEHVLSEAMPPEQARAYEVAVGAAKNGNISKGRMLEALHQLRGISLHHVAPENARDESYVEQSARLRAMLKVLDDLQKRGEKALIFLENLKMQSYLAALLQRRYQLCPMPMLINGDVAGPERQKRVNAFQTSGRGFDVIILSPRAGGVGLTLTAANHVIHLSRWWNPAVEDQCTDRVYRIGQEREVNVYYVQAIHPRFGEQSFDRRLHQLLERKRSLSREMLMPPIDPDNDARRLYEETVGAQAGASGEATAGTGDYDAGGREGQVDENPTLPLIDVIKRGESDRLEFKATFQWDVRQRQVNKDLRQASLKTIAAFLNTWGGTLLIGVEDDGTVRGLDDDLKTCGNSVDKLGQTLASSINEAIGPVYVPFYRSTYEEIGGKIVCRIEVKRSSEAVFMKGAKGNEFYVRQGNTTRSLDVEEAHRYIKLHWTT